MTKVEQLACFFQAKPNIWFQARDLEFAGRQAWRTRVSELRKPPFNMNIENRVLTLKSRFGGHYRISQYRLVTEQPSLTFLGD